MSSTMFRRAALRRVSSPEQLDTVVRAALPRQWVALAALLAVVAAAVIWACVATIPTTLSGPGYLLPLGGQQTVDAPVTGTLSALAVQVGEHVVPGEVLGTVTPAAAGGANPAPVSIMASANAGVITEVDDLSGTYVTAGQHLALVQPAGWPLVVYTYLPAGRRSGGAPARPPGPGHLLRWNRKYLRLCRGDRGIGEQLSGLATTPQPDPERRRAGESGPGARALGRDRGAAEPVRRDAQRHRVGLGAGSPRALPPGLPATVQLIVGSHHPISDVF